MCRIIRRRRSTEIPNNVISLLKGGLQCEEGGVEERLHGKDNLGEEAAGGGARGRVGGACGEEGRRGRSALEQLHDRQVFTFYVRYLISITVE